VRKECREFVGGDVRMDGRSVRKEGHGQNSLCFGMRRNRSTGQYWRTRIEQG
jgi:hypothetical protein